MLIGLCGYAGSGKDEAAKALVEQGWQRVAFADAVRAFAFAINPIIDTVGEGPFKINVGLKSVLQNCGWTEAKKHPEVRRLLQAIGTEGGREIVDPDVWVTVAQKKWRLAMENGFSAIVTDVRFPNEVAAIREDGGQLWRIVRPGVGPVNGHCSETCIDGIDTDVVIDNARGVEELHRIVRQLAGVEVPA